MNFRVTHLLIQLSFLAYKNPDLGRQIYDVICLF
jgi:hypothetical protein